MESPQPRGTSGEDLERKARPAGARPKKLINAHQYQSLPFKSSTLNPKPLTTTLKLLTIAAGVNLSPY